MIDTVPATPGKTHNIPAESLRAEDVLVSNIGLSWPVETVTVGKLVVVHALGYDEPIIYERADRVLIAERAA